MFQSCQIIIRELSSLLKLYYSIHNSIGISKRGVVAAYHVAQECVVEQWLGVRLMLSNERLVITYNTKNSQEIANELKRMQIDKQMKVITLDIKDLFVNLPVQGILTTTKFWLNTNIRDNELIKQTLHILEIIMKQNYFHYKSHCSTVHFCRITNIYQPTNAHIISHKTLLEHFKTLRHVSILSDHHQGT